MHSMVYAALWRALQARLERVIRTRLAIDVPKPVREVSYHHDFACRITGRVLPAMALEKVERTSGIKDSED